MTTHKHTLLYLLTLATLLVGFPATAADHSCCPRGKSAVATTTKLPAKPALLAVLQPEELIRKTLHANPDKPAAKHCTFMDQVEEWKAWRQRNPHAQSRYHQAPGGDGHNLVRVKLDARAVAGLTIDPDPDPEPVAYPLGCGCDMWDSCGIWHAVFGG